MGLFGHPCRTLRVPTYELAVICRSAVEDPDVGLKWRERPGGAMGLFGHPCRTLRVPTYV